MTALALILLSVVPRELVTEDRCDVLFVEHFYDQQGRLIFDQLVPLDWNRNQERWDVVCWRIIKCPNMVPERDWLRGGYAVRFMDCETPRIIRADSLREEWNQHDSELRQREYLPKEQRRGLYVRPRDR